MVNTSRLGLRDPRSSGGVMGVHVVHERARVHGHDEDGIDQVMEEGDGKFK